VKFEKNPNSFIQQEMSIKAGLISIKIEKIKLPTVKKIIFDGNSDA